MNKFIVGTGGETLDPVVTIPVTSGSGDTNMEDPSGNTNFNGDILVAGTGDYWGVMALTLHQGKVAPAVLGSRAGRRPGEESVGDHA
jgi:hypothetical protein